MTDHPDDLTEIEDQMGWRSRLLDAASSEIEGVLSRNCVVQKWDLRDALSRLVAAEARVAVLEGLLTEAGEELGLWLMLVTDGGVPRYTVCPGAALNSVVTSSRALAAKLEGRG